MIKEYIVKVSNKELPNAFALFEQEFSPAQELVRCKDCKYYPNAEHEWCVKGHFHGNPDTWFCADGKRR